jgi:glycerol-3-phosphate dehydrogenase (NAD(P)+)
MRVVVFGSGSWGTALTILLARNGHEVTMLGRDEEEIYALRATRENLHYLPGFVVPEPASFALFTEAPSASDMVVIAVPSGAVAGVLEYSVGSHPLVVVASKGLEAGTGRRLSEVVHDRLPEATVAAISGPNLAVEIARGIPTVAIAACEDRDTASLVRDTFNGPYFRVSISDDVVGVELAGALKNVLAIGAGMSDGLGFGDNTKGAFLSRGLMEMARLGAALGARAETFLGPAGVGDLFATASSQLSRNYRLGRALGQGALLTDAVHELGQVAEGVPTSEAVAGLARRSGVEMPVFAAVEGVLKAKIGPKQAVAMLMDRMVKMDDFL